MNRIRQTLYESKDAACSTSPVSSGADGEDKRGQTPQLLKGPISIHLHRTHLAMLQHIVTHTHKLSRGWRGSGIQGGSVLQDPTLHCLSSALPPKVPRGSSQEVCVYSQTHTQIHMHKNLRSHTHTHQICIYDKLKFHALSLLETHTHMHTHT